MSSNQEASSPAMLRVSVVGVMLAIAILTMPSADAHQVHQQLVHEEQRQSARERLQTFRETGDDHALHDAWADLEPMLGARASPDDLLDAALIAQALHKFAQALSLTERVLILQPRNDQAWLLANSIHLVLGDTDSASMACNRLRRSSPLVVVTCHARTATEQQKSTSKTLVRLLTSSAIANEATEIQAWSHSVAGDLAAAEGRDYSALRHYQQSLELAESTQVRSALVDALLRLNWLHEANDILIKGSRALPLEIRRLIVAKRQGNVDQQRIREIHQTFQAWMAAEDWLHAREMSRFYLDVADNRAVAARIAKINFAIQREIEDLRLLERSVTS